MARNLVQFDDSAVKVNVGGATVKSGDPVVVGNIVGVAQDDKDANDDVVVIRRGVFRLAVRGYDGTANAAVNVGDIVYYDSLNSELNVNTSGTKFGIALEGVAAGATTPIKVLLAG